MHFKFDDIDVRECTGWFQNSWVWCEELQRAVLIVRIDSNKEIYCRDGFQREFYIPFTSLDPFVPTLGYIEYVESNGRVSRNKTPNRMSHYFYNSGRRSYKRGISSDRIVCRITNYSIDRGNIVTKVKTYDTNTPQLVSNPTWIENAFKPNYCSINDIDVRRDDIILSRNFALKFKRFNTFNKDEDWTLEYRGVPIAPVSYGRVVRLNKQTYFLNEIILKEINNVQVSRV